MVEPLHPELRAALKRATPDLSDADIDRFEELISLRYTLDPERDADRLRAIDREREQLLREKLPHFQEVYQAFRARQVLRDQEATEEPTVTIEVIEPD